MRSSRVRHGRTVPGAIQRSRLVIPIVIPILKIPSPAGRGKRSPDCDYGPGSSRGQKGATVRAFFASGGRPVRKSTHPPRAFRLPCPLGRVRAGLVRGDRIPAAGRPPEREDSMRRFLRDVVAPALARVTGGGSCRTGSRPGGGIPAGARARVRTLGERVPQGGSDPQGGCFLPVFRWVILHPCPVGQSGSPPFSAAMRAAQLLPPGRPERPGRAVPHGSPGAAGCPPEAI